MRVIAGSARRLLLKTLDGLDTRPTTDRIKETLFNMLQPELADCMFLDLFSGSGAIGIEALSRGAGLAVMIENNPKALECIRENLSRTKLEDRAMVMGCDVITGLKRLEGKNYRFDIVFMDPPYNHEYERLVLDYLNHSPMVTEETLIVIEASRETEFGWLEESGWHMIKSKVTSSLPNVEIQSFEGLLIDFVRRSHADIVVRGLRAITDFEYELQMAQTNRVIAPEIDTIFLTTNLKYSYLSSSIVKEIAEYEGDISEFLHPVIAARVREKLEERRRLT